MKLYYGSTSPFVRKVVVAAIECGLDGQLQRVPTLPWDPDTTIGGVNPLGKVPALETDDGQVLYDSRVIVEYLDTLHGGDKLIPPFGPARFEALRVAALGDGMMEAVILLFSELQRRPPELHWDYWDQRMRSKVARALDALNADCSHFDADAPDLAQITAACGVGWIEFRRDILGIDTAAGRPDLAAWFQAFSARPSMRSSMPVAH